MIDHPEFTHPAGGVLRTEGATSVHHGPLTTCPAPECRAAIAAGPEAVYLNSPLPGCEPAMPATSGRALADATSPETAPIDLPKPQTVTAIMQTCGVQSGDDPFGAFIDCLRRETESMAIPGRAAAAYLLDQLVEGLEQALTSDSRHVAVVARLIRLVAERAFSSPTRERQS